MILGSEKKKKHGGYAVAIGALAMYGAYRIIAGMKSAVCSGASGMMRIVNKMKKKSSGDDCCSDITDNAYDSESEPYD